MTEDQIERAVARKIDRLDARFMAGKLTQEEYDAVQKEISKWADREYSWGRQLALASRRLSPASPKKRPQFRDERPYNPA